MTPFLRFASFLRFAPFLRFAMVGASGVLVDAAVVYALRAPLGLYAAGFVSYAVAATWNWAWNRAWTFAGRGGGSAWSQWLRFLAVNLVGLVFNRGVYVALIAGSALCRDNPILAIAAGAVAGLGANYGLSRRLVFTAPAGSAPRSPPAPPR